MKTFVLLLLIFTGHKLLSPNTVMNIQKIVYHSSTTFNNNGNNSHISNSQSISTDDDDEGDNGYNRIPNQLYHK